MDKLPDYSDKRFLIVDDEPFMLSLVDRMLKQCKAGLIVKAVDGGSAMRSVKDNFTQVDCIISDCNMKPINGLQLLQGIRTGVNPRIPRDQAFIMLTGHGDTEVVKTALSLDVSGYVVKPVDLDKLISTIEKVLKRTHDVKEADIYRAIKLPQMQSAFGDSVESKKPAWVVIPKGGLFKNADVIKSKIEQFKSEHATQDGASGAVKLRNYQECLIDKLKEGHILAQDIEAEEGVIMLRRGTSLSKGMIARLHEITAETNAKETVWIAEVVKD